MVVETTENDRLLEATLGSTTDSTTLANLMNHSREEPQLNIDPVSTSLIHTLAVILSCLSSPNNPQNRGSEKSSRPGLDAFNSRINDVIRSADMSIYTSMARVSKYFEPCIIHYELHLLYCKPQTK